MKEKRKKREQREKERDLEHIVNFFIIPRILHVVGFQNSSIEVNFVPELS